MYFSSWIVLVVLSLGASVIAFIWGVRSGQFTDQNRARYLPLTGEPLLSHPSDGKAKRSKESYALLGIVIIGFAAFFTALALGIYHLKG